MTALTPQFFRLLEADTKVIFFQEFMQLELLREKLFATRTSSKGYEDRMEMAGLGPFVVKSEGTPVSFSDPVQGGQVRTVHSTYGLGGRFSMEVMQDDQFGMMRQIPGDMGNSARDHKDRIAFDLLNDAFNGTTYTGVAGQPLFNTAHTRLRPGVATQSNQLSPAVALSVSGLEAIMNLAKTTLSHEGRYITLAPDRLLIHPNLAHNAYVLLNTEFRPGSSDNDRSTVVSSRSGITTIVESPYMTSTTAWSVHAPPGKNGLTINNRMGLEMTSAVDPDTKDMKHYAIYRESVQTDNWEGNFGSNS